MRRLATLLVAVAALAAAVSARAATAPTAGTGSASAVGTTSATLNGTVDPNGTATSVYFQYGTTSAYGSTTATQGVGSGTSTIAVVAPITGLQPGTVYHFRLVATSAGGTSMGADESFATAPAAGASAPAVATGSATKVSASSATLNGTVTPNGQTTTWYFDYGTSTAYGSRTAVKSLAAGTKPASVAAAVSGLHAGTVYHYRLVATNASGTTLGADQTFATVGPPAVQTGAAQSVGVNSATLTGTVSPNGRATSWHFDYGTTTAYGSHTASESAGSGGAAEPVSAGLAGLAPGTTYHYRLVATSSAGTTYGADQTFTTLAAVTMARPAARVVAGRAVTLSGTVAGSPPGTKVAIMAQPFGATSFTEVATVATGAGGAWRYLARPTIQTTYQASANGGTSAPATVGVRPAVSLRLVAGGWYRTQVRAGAASFAGRSVQLQRRDGDRWVTVRRSRLGRDSAATFRASLVPAGTEVRVALSVNQAGPGYLAGFSRALTAG